MSEPVIDPAPAGLLTLAADLTIVTANDWLGRIVGADPGSLIGTPFESILSMPARILFQTHVFPALKADGRVEEVFLTLANAADPEPTPVLLNAVRLPSDAGGYALAIMRIRARARWETDLLDATRAIDRERAESQRIAADLAAVAEDLAARRVEEQRNHAFRDAFIGVVSHELRTPITTIFGMSQVLRRRFAGMDAPTVAQYLDDIADEADRLRRLTEDLLVLSRAEGRKLVVSDDPIVVYQIIRDAISAEKTRLADHPCTLEGSPGLPFVLGEATHLEQVVRNLLSNAAKYSPPGSPIRVAVTGEAGGVAVRVIDQGPGVPEEAREHLFEAFYRTRDAMHTASGAGIGLFVCHELVEAMGGRIWVASAPAPATTGSEFGFWLPAAQVDDRDD